MSKRAPFKYPKWKLSRPMDNGAFVKILIMKFVLKKKKKKNSGVT